MADLVRDDIGAREISGGMKPRVHFMEEIRSR